MQHSNSASATDIANPTTDGIKYVTKRDGTMQEIDQGKIKQRLVALSDGLNLKYINFDVIVNKVYTGIYSGKFSFL